METPVRKVFALIGVCVLSLLLWDLVFVRSRPVIWGAIEPMLLENWRMYTYEDGRLIEEVWAEEFEKVSDISTR